MDGTQNINTNRKSPKSFVEHPSKTQQHFKDGTRIDSVLKRYAALGVNPNDVGLFRSTLAGKVYGVADTTYDYQYQLNKLNEVKSYFDSLPSGIRDRFRNDPAQMLRFMADPRNIEECVKMGLFASPEGSNRKKPGENPPTTPPGGADNAPSGAASTPPGGAK